MLKVENLVTPSPEWWEVVVKGVRLPFKSGDKSDSGICTNSEEEKELCYQGCQFVEHWEGEEPYCYPICGFVNPDEGPVFVLGEKDRNLLLNLCKAGDPSDRKFLRQLPVIMDITAPEYWWRQLDTYKVGTTANSTSQMHTLLKRPIELSDFSFDYVKLDYAIPKEIMIQSFRNMREAYLNSDDKEEKKILWHQLLELIPQSFNYTRTWSANYEVLLTIIKQRKNHKLKEWHTLINIWLRNVPYLKEFAITAGAITEEEIDKIKESI